MKKFSWFLVVALLLVIFFSGCDFSSDETDLLKEFDFAVLNSKTEAFLAFSAESITDDDDDANGEIDSEKLRLFQEVVDLMYPFPCYHEGEMEGVSAEELAGALVYSKSETKNRRNDHLDKRLYGFYAEAISKNFISCKEDDYSITTDKIRTLSRAFRRRNF